MVDPDGTILFCNQRFCELSEDADPGGDGPQSDGVRRAAPAAAVEDAVGGRPDRPGPAASDAAGHRRHVRARPAFRQPAAGRQRRQRLPGGDRSDRAGGLGQLDSRPPRASAGPGRERGPLPGGVRVQPGCRRGCGQCRSLRAGQPGRPDHLRPAAGEAHRAAGRGFCRQRDPVRDHVADVSGRRQLPRRDAFDRGRRTAVRYVDADAVANMLPGQHLWVIHDITERKQAEQAMRRARRNSAPCTRCPPLPSS